MTDTFFKYLASRLTRALIYLPYALWRFGRLEWAPTNSNHFIPIAEPLLEFAGAHSNLQLLWTRLVKRRRCQIWRFGLQRGL